MPIAEGRAFPFESVDHIRTDFLETFPYAGVRQYITYDTKEFSAVCPFSGLPDIARIAIEYIPNNMCLELKSLKYYYLSFRNVGIYQEAVTDRVFKDLYAVLSPTYLKVTTIYNTRGGIDATCVCERGQKVVSN